eukprot:1837337-Amphidinium_carterae.1
MQCRKYRQYHKQDQDEDDEDIDSGGEYHLCRCTMSPHGKRHEANRTATTFLASSGQKGIHTMHRHGSSSQVLSLADPRRAFVSNPAEELVACSG